MARLLFAYAQRQCARLHEKNFILGNVLPDYLPTFVSRPHFLKYCTGYVQKTRAWLLERYPSGNASSPAMARYSRRLGMLCHLYTDFFCYAHCAQFPPGLKRHLEYEQALTLFFEQNYEAFLARPMIASAHCAPDLQAQFERLQAAYLAAERGYLSDIAYAFFACAQLIAAVCRESEETGMQCAQRVG